MVRLRNAAGVVVDVSDETAKLLGSGWEPADKPAPATAPAEKPASKSASKPKP